MALKVARAKDGTLSITGLSDEQITALRCGLASHVADVARRKITAVELGNTIDVRTYDAMEKVSEALYQAITSVKRT